MINTPILCTVAGLGTLALAQFNRVGQIAVFDNLNNDLLVYSPLVALVLALLVWHLDPRSWAGLVVLGALCTISTQLFLLTPESFAPWTEIPYLAVSSAAKPVLLVGLLGAATAVWRAGRHGAGAALIGATLVVPPLTSLFLTTANGFSPVVPVIGLVLIAATVGLAIAAGVRPVEPAPRPDWRVTVGGAVASAAPVVYYLWRGPDAGPTSGLDPETYYEQAGQHMLLVGLVILGVGLLAGLFAGVRVLVTGAAGGLLLGGVGSLVGSAWYSTRDLPAGVPAAVAVAAVVAGVGVGLRGARVLVGTIGLGVVILGLAMLWLVYSADDAVFDARVLLVMLPILLVVAVIAAVALLASLGSVLAPPGEAPAALAGVVAAVAAGVDGITTYFAFTNYGARSTTSGTIPPMIVVLVCAAGLVILVHQRWRHTPPPMRHPEPRPAGQLTW